LWSILYSGSFLDPDPKFELRIRSDPDPTHWLCYPSEFGSVINWQEGSGSGFEINWPVGSVSENIIVDQAYWKTIAEIKPYFSLKFLFWHRNESFSCIPTPDPQWPDRVDPDPVLWIRIRSDPKLLAGSGSGSRSGKNSFGSGSRQPGSEMEWKLNYSEWKGKNS